MFYDIGSRFGFFSKYAKQVGVQSENIHSFEANRYRYYLLQENLVDEEQIVHSRVDSSTGRRSVSIDRYTDRHKSPTVVKIDVEGAEYDVLQGLTATIENSSPKLYVETHPQLLAQFGHTDDDLLRLLERYEYDVQIQNHRESEDRYSSEIDERPTEGTYLLRAEREGRMDSNDTAQI